MRTSLVFVAVVLAAVVACSAVSEDSWNRANNPFARVAKQVGSFIEEVNKPEDNKANPAQQKVDANKAKVAAAAGGKIVPAHKEPDAILKMLGNSGANGGDKNGQSAALQNAVSNALKAAQGQPADQNQNKDQNNNQNAAPTAAAGSACQGVPTCQGKPDAAKAEAKPGFNVLVAQTKKGEDIDIKKLGGTDKMSVDSAHVKEGEKLIKSSDGRHEQFLAKHEKDCSGKLCGENKDKKF